MGVFAHLFSELLLPRAGVCRPASWGCPQNAVPWSHGQHGEGTESKVVRRGFLRGPLHWGALHPGAWWGGIYTSQSLPRNAQGVWAGQRWGAGYACAHPTPRPSSGHRDSVPLLVLFSELFPATPSPADRSHLGLAPSHPGLQAAGCGGFPRHLPGLVEIAHPWAMGHTPGRP